MKIILLNSGVIKRGVMMMLCFIATMLYPAFAQGVVEGYYRVISAGNGSGYSEGPYNFENKVAWYNDGGVVRWMDYDSSDYGMIYYLAADGDNWTFFNLKDKTYVGKGTGLFACEVATATTASLQHLTQLGDNKYIIQAAEAPYIYAMTNSHNGSSAPQGFLNVWGTPAEAEQYGVNLWYLAPVSEEIVKYLEENDEQISYTIGDSPVEPMAGKKYVIRNATKGLYLTSNGALTSDVSNEPEYFWQLDEADKKADGHATYYLKSICKDAYWQHVDYASQTWQDGSPYDGYDWYSYAGLNAEFGAMNSAMQLTVLKAGSTGDWRSAGASSGYVLAMTQPVVTNKTYYYKLGTQDNNVAMEPWDENVGWDFYLVTVSGNLSDDLQNALDSYGHFNTSVTTSSDPGYYDTNKVQAYQEALLALKSLTGTEAKATIKEAIARLKEAYEAVSTPNPIREGYFYIVTAGKGSGYPASSQIKHDNENQAALYNEDGLVRWTTFDENNFNQIYHFAPDGTGRWYVSSALNGSYINRGSSSYSTKVSTSIEPTTSQEFIQISEGKFAFRFNGNPYVYSPTATHNGTNGESGTLNIWGTPEEASQCGMNVWYVKEVPESVMEQFAKTDAGLMSLCAAYEAAANALEIDTKPGYYIQANVDTFKEAIAEAKNKVFEQTTDEEKLAIRQGLKEAYDKALATVPITDGYYYLVSNYENYKTNYGAVPAIYTAPDFSLGVNGSACYYDKFDPNNANYVYKITHLGTGDEFMIQNAYTGWYLNTGEGNNATGELLTCTDSDAASQIVRWKSAGRFWIADNVDNTSGHAIANAASLNKRGFIVGGPSYEAAVGSDVEGYNTWSLVPLNQAECDIVIARYKKTRETIEQAYQQMLAYNESIAPTYDVIVANEKREYNTDAITGLKSARKVVTTYISTKSYDITSVADDYLKAKTELEAAVHHALTAKPDTTETLQLSGTPIGAVSVDYNTSQPSTTVNTPAEVFDNDFTTYYAAYERSTGWVGLDLGEKFVITKVAYAPRGTNAKRLQLGVFEGANSEDFSDAIPFHVIKDIPATNEMTYADVDCSRGFRYVRYVGPNDARCNISELRFYGSRGEGDDSHLYQVTNLPLVVFRTEANVSEVTSKTTWLPGRVNIISDNGATLKADSMNVRGRGNGSWSFEKKPYKFKLANKAKLLNMPAKAKEWTLINNYGDKTMIRNNVAFKISEIFEMDYTPACTLVDVIFNGQYKGSYQLCDQVEVHKKRVDVTEMTSDDNEGEPLTGGYLIELDAYAGSEPKHFTSGSYGIPVTVHYPDNDDITPQQFEYIQKAFNTLTASVYYSYYKDEELGYKNYMDEESWLKYFLIEELSGNTDGYWSVYMAKDRNDVFRTYPVWDFDLAFDNDRRTHPILTMTDFLCLSSKSSAASGVRNFNRRIVESCSKQLTELWSWYRYEGDLNYETLKAAVDSLGAENALSAEYNYIRWDILNKPTQQQYTVRGSYKAEVDFLNEYLYDRLAWLDNKVGLEEPIGVHSTLDSEVRGGIHARDGYVLVRGFAEGSHVSIHTVSGGNVVNARITDFDNRFDLPKGVYIIKVTDNTGKTATQKVAIR